jgi:hypothetical protein
VIRHHLIRLAALAIGSVMISYAYVMIMGFVAVNFPSLPIHRFLGPIAPYTVGWIASVVLGVLVVLPLGIYLFPNPIKTTFLLSTLVVAFLFVTSMSFRMSGVTTIAVSDYVGIISVFTLCGYLSSHLVKR